MIFNGGKGRAVELYKQIKAGNPANSAFIVVMLKVGEADATLEDRANLSEVFGGANTEADFTNYARIVWAAGDLAALPPSNNTSNRYELDFPDISIPSAGGGVDNTMTNILLCYDPDTTGGTDADIETIASFPYTEVTSGSTIGVQFPVDAFYAA